MKLTIRTKTAAGLFFLLLLLSFLPAVSQQKNDDVFVDRNGVMRWRKTKEEIHAFGVNYTTPFAHAYRTAKNKNLSLEKIIDDDVYHFARLGFDLYRVHVWDCEISDSVGNLLNNEHLKLFDYMVKKMKDRGMKFVLTPIAYWPNGYPEPEEKTPGFATKYGKDACLTDEAAIKAQENYLFQFLDHVNPYTGVAYKNDPTVIAFEISNEPHHREAPEKVTAFISRMMASMRKTGCKKPIFYNISHSIQLEDAYFNAGIQGGTFQWYPTGLGARHELGGNLLPNVDRYAIPFSEDPKFKKIAKLVYEFDAADVGRSYIYPAMARSFREAGMQIATHFAYDPTFMADVNTEYNTHYMNLVYAPQKALSLKIAAEVFHNIPMYKSFGAYPTNSSFGVFKVSYEKDLAEMNSENKFVYTNHTTSQPVSPGKLQEVAGWGNSSVVKYEGTGAYFLDRLEAGVWRLEVMPDAAWIQDPFGWNSPRKKVAVVNWRSWPITLNLSDLGESYTVKALNDGNNFSTTAEDKTFTAAPGTYLLTRKDVSTTLTGDSRWKNILLKEFVAPPPGVKAPYVLHKPAEETPTDKPYTIEATIVTARAPEAVEISFFGRGWRPEVVPMEHVGGYAYRASLPEGSVKEGFLRYYISVKERDRVHTFPSGIEGSPSDWDFYDDQSYTIRVVPANAPLYLFNAMTDADQLSRQWGRSSVLNPLDEPGKAELLVNVEKLAEADPENKKATAIHDYSMRSYFGAKIAARQSDLAAAQKIVFRGRALNDKPCKLQLALIMKDGTAYGGVVTVGVERQDCDLLLRELKVVKLVTLPRPYPTFLPYYFNPSATCDFTVKDIESLQLSIGPEIPEQEFQDKHGVAIESIRLE